MSCMSNSNSQIAGGRPIYICSDWLERVTVRYGSHLHITLPRCYSRGRKSIGSSIRRAMIVWQYRKENRCSGLAIRIIAYNARYGNAHVRTMIFTQFVLPVDAKDFFTKISFKCINVFMIFLSFGQIQVNIKGEHKLCHKLGMFRIK